MIIDSTDLEILRSLVKDSRRSKADLGRSVGLTPTAVFERLRKLEEHGVITGYRAKIDPQAFGKTILSYVFVSEIKPVRNKSTSSRLAQLPEVEEIHRIAGKDCFLLKLRAADTIELSRILDKIGSIDSVSEVRTTIVLETFLEKTWDFIPDPN